MRTNARRRGARLLAAAHVTQAAVLLVQPAGLLAAIVGDEGLPPSWIVRVLGLRTLGQGFAEGVRPTRDVLRVGVGVDLVHAASMLAAARLWPRYRRAALTSAGSAGASALVGVVLAGAGQ